MTTFTDKLRSEAGEQWDRVINHKFTTELASGKINREVLKRYLIQDHRFLDSFVVLLASMVAKARTLEDRIPGCQFLALITGTENTYFERSFEKLGCAEKSTRDKIPNEPCTSAFINLMQEVAQSGNLGEMLSVLVVCEWSYLQWGQKVENHTNRDDFMTYEWVDLHSGEGFEGVVNYLRGLLDREGDVLDDVNREQCKKRFLQAIEIEEQFFDFAYSK
mmetsp:Transcript_51718/g.60427  ORF Transcript_51718/g.60427 Transcript_51718/m.60427 type:complete len:219 (+) Transcript_51718:38-694(+)